MIWTIVSILTNNCRKTTISTTKDDDEGHYHSDYDNIGFDEVNGNHNDNNSNAFDNYQI